MVRPSSSPWLSMRRLSSSSLSYGPAFSHSCARRASCGDIGWRAIPEGGSGGRPPEVIQVHESGGALPR